MSKNPFSRDRMNSANSDQVGRAAFHVVSALQHHPAEHQVLGLALAFLAVCERYGVGPGDAHAIVARVYSQQGKPPVVLALEDYMRNEIT